MSCVTRGAALLFMGVFLCISVVGCVGGGTNAQRGALLTVGDTKAAVLPPLGIFWSRVRAPVNAGAPKEIGVRRGEATVHQIAIPPLPMFGLNSSIPLVSWGEASQSEAARNGGLQDVNHLDYELTTIFMFFRRFKLIAYGE